MLAEIAQRDISLARLVEGHADALSILAEAEKGYELGACYAVWASEGGPIESLKIDRQGNDFFLSGGKAFCTGAGIVDRALITCGLPEPLLLDIDLRISHSHVRVDRSAWHPEAFAQTQTAVLHFERLPLTESNIVGSRDWYLRRPGFWNGACGPAACWAGGAYGLIEYAMNQARESTPMRIYIGRLRSIGWAFTTFLDQAGNEIDADPTDDGAAVIRALQLRHLIEDGCLTILEQFGRALGPRPLAFDRECSRRYQELTLYIRQCHADNDLDLLGQKLMERGNTRSST
jgi:alkylation response protein AidB-like acyl-CoA dehydrogenase